MLHLNGLLDADAALDAQRLPAIRMPKRDGFVRRRRATARDGRNGLRRLDPR